MVKLANVSEACTGNRTLSAYQWWMLVVYFTYIISGYIWGEMISSATVPNIHLNLKTQIDLIFQAQVMLRSFPFENQSFKGFISAVTHGRGLCPTLGSLQELNHLHPPVKPTTTSPPPPSNGWNWKTLSRFLLGFWRIFRGRTVSFKESVARDVDI